MKWFVWPQEVAGGLSIWRVTMEGARADCSLLLPQTGSPKFGLHRINLFERVR